MCNCSLTRRIAKINRRVEISIIQARLPKYALSTLRILARNSGLIIQAIAPKIESRKADNYARLARFGHALSKFLTISIPPIIIGAFPVIDEVAIPRLSKSALIEIRIEQSSRRPISCSDRVHCRDPEACGHM